MVSLEISELLCDCIICFQAYLAASTVKQNTVKTHYYSFILYFLVECLLYYRKEQRIIYIFFGRLVSMPIKYLSDKKLSIDVKTVRRFTTKRQVSGHVRSSNTINALYKRQHHRPIISSQSRPCI